MLREHRLFFRQFRENFHATGSIAPSSRWLAQALARYVVGDTPGRQGNGSPVRSGLPGHLTTPSQARGRRILEVGPGTGAVTRWIVRRLGPEDRLDLVELNDQFVAHLRRWLETHPEAKPVANRVRVLHRAIEDIDAGESYDAVVSGLPLNNFPSDVVQRLLRHMLGLLAPGGTLSFFEYVAVRPAKMLVARGEERRRLREISGHLQAVLGPHEFHRECVLRNVPPAWVHHVRAFPSAG